MPELIVRVLGDASALEREFKKASRASDRFSKNLEQTGRGAIAATATFRGLGRSVAFASTAFLGGLGFTAALKSSVSAASDLNEQMSKTTVVFEDSADEVLNWSRTTATSFGLARRQALATASSFGALFAPLGIVGDQAAEQSQRLTELGADLASFYNTDVQSALDAIRSGLVGESEPLRRYGALLSETRVVEEALNQTHKKTAKELTAQEKVLARIALIYRDTARAQGDFSRTSDGLANQQRILSAQIDDLQTRIGALLTPKILEVVEAMNEWLAETENQEQVTKDLDKTLQVVIRTLEITAEAVGFVANRFREVKGAIETVNDGLRGLEFGGVDWGFLTEGLVPQIRAIGDETDKGKRHVEDFTFAMSGLADAATRAEAAMRAAAPAASVFADAASRATEIERIQREQPGGTTGGDKTEETLKALGLNALIPARVRLALAQARTEAEKRSALFAELAAVNKRLAGRLVIDDRIALEAEKTAILQGIAAINAAELEARQEAADKVKAAQRKHLEGLRALFDEAPAKIFLGQPQINAAVRDALRTLQQRDAARRRARQFTALGLTSAGQELAPTRDALRQQLREVERGLAGSILDTDANRNMVARIRKVLSGQLGALARDVRVKIKALLDALGGERGALLDPTKFKHLSGAKFRERLGLNLSGIAARQFDAAFAQVGAGGRIPAGRSLAFSGAGTRPIHVRVDIDGKQVAQATARPHEELAAKRARSRPQVRRGAR